MKSIKNKLIAGVTLTAMVFTISSCWKKYDAASYAPKKPLPKIEGYDNSKDVAPGALVAYWPFNGTLQDSLSSTTGTATKTTFGTGVSGKGLQGADGGYVVSDVPDAVKNLHSFTLSLWAKTPQNAKALALFDIDNDQPGGPGFWGSMTVFFDTGDPDTPTSGNLKAHVFNVTGSDKGMDAWEGGYTVSNPWDKWINIMITYDDQTSTVNVYYNAALAGTNVATGFAPLNWTKAKKMVFGTFQFQTTPSLTANTGAQDWASFLTGSLDQVRFYNRVLTDTEMKGLYGLEKAGR